MFPAPETSYTTKSGLGQVLYIPRTIMVDADIKIDYVKYGDRTYYPPGEEESKTYDESTVITIEENKNLESNDKHSNT